MADKLTCRNPDCDYTHETFNGLTTHERRAHGKQYDEWKDEERIRRMYVKERKSQAEIADELNVSCRTVQRYMEKCEIERRSQGGKKKLYAKFRTTSKGYEHWLSVNSPKSEYRSTYPVHRLLAVAEFGVEAVKDEVVHHKNRIRWDNRPSNIDIMPQSQHATEHSINSQFSEFDKRLISELHSGTKESMEQLATVVDCSTEYLYNVTRKYRE